ncbi:hypothetical protein ABIA35_003958 [Catenulispora sp. MAP12-49]|uniref:hypothetical protein n=1 Tax=unclassified Catenulispora TaxID=414885 RepID=UPI003519BB34
MVIDGGSGGPGRTGDGGPRRGRPGRAPRIEQPQTIIRLPKDPYDGEFKAPRARRGRGVLALAAVVVVVAAVIAINSSRHNTGAASQGASTGVGGGVPPATATVGQSAPAGAASSPAFPSGSIGSVLVGYPNSQAGAESAAANYVSAFASDDMVHPDSRHKLIQAIADPAIEPALQQSLDTAFNRTLSAYGLDAQGNPPKGQTFVYRNVPIGVSVQSYTNAKAVVAVWDTTIDGIAGQGSTEPITQTWSTSTLTLTWVNNDWRLNDFSQSDGPTPVSTQQGSVPADIQKAVQQFARLRYAP